MHQKFKVLFCLFIYGLLIHAQNNSIVIISESGNPFYLFLNGKQINTSAQSDVKAFNARNGWNNIKIKKSDSIQFIYNDSIFINDKFKFTNKEFTYIIIEKGNNIKINFKSITEHSAPEKPFIPLPPKNIPILTDNNSYGNLYQMVNNKPVFLKNYNSENQLCANAINDTEINYALNLIDKANDPETAYGYLNQIIELNCYTVKQLEQLLNLSTIDIDKLNLAKKGYTHIQDPEHIEIIYSCFKYTSIKDAYISFVKEQKNISVQKKLNCTTPIDSSKYEVIYMKFKNTSNDNQKINIAKNICLNICMTTHQIKKISNLFTADSKKLELFKESIYTLTDKENIKSLANEFKYQGTKNDFLNFISKQ